VTTNDLSRRTVIAGMAAAAGAAAVSALGGTIQAKAATSTTTWAGSYVLPADFGETTVNAGCADWSSSVYFNRTIKARRQYYGPGVFPSSVTTDPQDDITAGRRVTMSFKPAYNPVSSSDLSKLDNFLSQCKAAGLHATVALWHEPYPQGLTTTQYANMIAYYGPTVRKYYWLSHSQASYAIANGTISASQYFNACASGSFNLISGDIYCPAWLIDSNILNQFAGLADSNGLPFALWEFNGNPAQQSQSQITSFFNAIYNVFAGRKSAGKGCGDILLFDHSDGTANCSFVGSGDFRIPLVRKIYDLMNGAVI
jgi:hypothetical protein